MRVTRVMDSPSTDGDSMWMGAARHDVVRTLCQGWHAPDVWAVWCSCGHEERAWTRLDAMDRWVGHHKAALLRGLFDALAASE